MNCKHIIGWSVVLFFSISCGESIDRSKRELEISPRSDTKTVNAESERENVDDEFEYKELKTIVSNLQVTLALFESFTTNEFFNCSDTLDVFQKKICKIAQSSNAEQSVLFGSQLSEIVKMFQIELYGDDCINEIESDCPKVGSISERVTSLENRNDPIPDLQDDIISLQNQYITFSSRLDQFNGTSESIEAIISDMDAQIIDLESRISEIETVINDHKWFKTGQLCGSNETSGPIYESVIYDAAFTHIISFKKIGRSSGLTILSEIGDGDKYLSTGLNTKKCNFKIYDRNTDLHLCWDTEIRKSSEDNLDIICDAFNNFENKMSNCDCLE